MYCANCGKQIEENSICDCQSNTSSSQNNQPPPQPPPTYQNQPPQPAPVYYNQPVKNSNGSAVAGFVLALIGVFISWIPVIGWIIWLLGLIFSCVGLGTAKRKQSGLGLSIAGLVLSLLGLIIVIIAIITAAAFLVNLPFWIFW